MNSSSVIGNITRPSVNLGADIPCYLSYVVYLSACVLARHIYCVSIIVANGLCANTRIYAHTAHTQGGGHGGLGTHHSKWMESLRSHFFKTPKQGYLATQKGTFYKFTMFANLFRAVQPLLHSLQRNTRYLCTLELWHVWFFCRILGRCGLRLVLNQRTTLVCRNLLQK